ncbi:MAG: RagB/SusD family nutrient uptake outer membrane protein [Cyclobacteriaceae bacterium]
MKLLINKSNLTKALTLVFVLLAFSCSDLLDSVNPNNLVEDDLSDPRSAGPMSNGLQAVVTRAIGNMLTPYSTSTDEMIWTGSRDAWEQLNVGQLSDPANEFTDAAFFFTGEARWWADEVISRIEGFQSDGTLDDEEALARSYMYGAIIYMLIGDMYDDFAFSDKLEGAPPVGSANMSGLYDTAIGFLNKAVALNVTGYDGQLNGLLARANWSKDAWTAARARTGGTAALINNTAAVAAATAALATGSDLILETSSATPGAIVGLDIGGEVNDRQEQTLSPNYVIIDPDTDNSVNGAPGFADPAQSISLMDPIDLIPDPVLFAAVVDFTDQGIYPDYTIVSDREMMLILAESELAQGDNAGFATQINALRALDGLTAWNDVTPQIPAIDLLIHERRVNLFLQGRRLTDHYRFADDSPQWISVSDATNSVTFFPISLTEIRANDFID